MLVDLDCGRRQRLFVRATALGCVRAEIVPSDSPGHFHALVTLPEKCNAIARASYALRLGSDPTHVGHDLMRLSLGWSPWSLLITRRAFSRPPDAVCDCPNKHAGLGRMRVCDVGKTVRPHDVRDWYGTTHGFDEDGR